MTDQTELEAVARAFTRHKMGAYSDPALVEAYVDAHWEGNAPAMQAAIAALDAHRIAGADKAVTLIDRLLGWTRWELHRHHTNDINEAAALILAQKAEIERLREFERRTTPEGGDDANRYWEARYRDEAAENERLRDRAGDLLAEVDRLANRDGWVDGGQRDRLRQALGGGHE